MPPKQRITREMILNRSFEMFCEGGLGVVNARSVARALNCSTQPIFSYFSGMEDLKDSIEAKALEEYNEAVALSAESENQLEELCGAYTSFAARMPSVFEHLFMRLGSNDVKIVCTSEQRAAFIAVECEKNGISEEAAGKVVDQLCIYAHGLAALCVRGKSVLTEEVCRKSIAEMHAILQANAKG